MAMLSNIAFQGFEAESLGPLQVFDGTVGTSFDMINGNNGGSLAVDSTGASTTAGFLGYDSTWSVHPGDPAQPMGGFFYAVDADASRAAPATGQAAPDGSQVFFTVANDGIAKMTFDAVDVSGHTGVVASFYIGVRHHSEYLGGVEDFVRAKVIHDTGEVSVVDFSVTGIAAQGLNAGWYQHSAMIPDAATSAQLVIETSFPTNSSGETDWFFFDAISFDGIEIPSAVTNTTQATTHPTIQDAFDNAAANDAISVDETQYTGGEGALVTRTDGLDLQLNDYGAPGYTTVVVATGANSFDHTGDADMYLRVTRGDKTVSTGTGDDLVKAFAGNNQIDTGAGNDRAYGGDGNDTLMGGDGNDLLVGGADFDILNGGAGVDRLYGGAGSDQLSDGDGNDTLAAGQGSDTIGSGAGHDRIYLGDTDQLGDGAADTLLIDANTLGQDRVWGFEDNVDQIILSGFAGGLADIGIFDDAPNNRAIVFRQSDGLPQANSPWLISVFGMTSGELQDDLVFI